MLKKAVCFQIRLGQSGECENGLIPSDCRKQMWFLKQLDLQTIFFSWLCPSPLLLFLFRFIHVLLTKIYPQALCKSMHPQSISIEEMARAAMMMLPLQTGESWEGGTWAMMMLSLQTGESWEGGTCIEILGKHCKTNFIGTETSPSKKSSFRSLHHSFLFFPSLRAYP